MNFILLSGYLKSSGVFFVALLSKFNAPATHTALLFAIRAGIFSICGEEDFSLGPRTSTVSAGLAWWW